MRDSLSPNRLGCSRVGVTGVLLFAHLVATFGWPLPSVDTGKPRDIRGLYPCASRLCGCSSYDECWAGDCCCFTLQEKVDWALRHDLNFPSNVPELLSSSGGESCCAKEHEAECPGDAGECCHADGQHRKPRWIVGLFAQKCKPVKLGYGMLEPTRPFDLLEIQFEAPAPGDRLIPESELATKLHAPPDSPPPNHV